jgi:signal transduction histidine kinase
MAAGVAHELGNPLNGITIHLQLMERAIKKMGKSADKLQKHLDVASGEIKRLDLIITQFLAAIRPTKPQLQRADVNELIEESVRFLKPELDRSDVKVTLELRSDLPVMQLDVNQMKQVFYNLVRNACQAMPDGGKLLISTTFNDLEVILSFQDSGKGISAENMGNLFQPFFTTRRAGTGLGLLVVRRIVREHGGEISIGSRKGEGTRVSLLMPLVEKRVRMLGGGDTDFANAP